MVHAHAHVSSWDAIKRLPQVPRKELQATNFNDYYKLAMSRVQFLYAYAKAGSPA